MALSDGIVHFYALEEASGDRVDSVGSTDLSEVTAANISSAAGKFGTAIDLDELAGSAVRNVAPPTQTPDFSVSFWIQETTNPSGSHVLVARDDNTSGNWFIISQSGINTRFLGGFGSWSLLCSTLRTAGTTWYHIVCTRAQNGPAVIYLDGADCGSVADSGAADLSDNTADLSIGGRESGAYAAGECPDAVIDQVIIWNRALTSDEVTSLYNGGDGLADAEILASPNPTSEIADTWGSTDSDFVPRGAPPGAARAELNRGRPSDAVMDFLFPPLSPPARRARRRRK